MIQRLLRTDVQDILFSPTYYPVLGDFERREVVFVEMSRESYHDSLFLDLSRIRPIRPHHYYYRLDDLLLAAYSDPSPRPGIHYILHTAFCCSTLLARYLEMISSCLVLKEPRILTQLALASDRKSVEWSEWFKLLVMLLGRVFNPSDTVVVKLHDRGNSIGLDLLMHDSRATLTFLTGSLKHSIVSFLKPERRSRWLPIRKRAAAKDAVNIPELEGVKVDELTDAQSAAFIWLTNMLLCSRLRSRFDSSRIIILDGHEVASSPLGTLRAVTQLGGILLREQELEKIVAGPLARRHSKDSSRPYDAEARREEIAAMEAHFCDEAAGGIRWVTDRGFDVEALQNMCQTTQSR